MKVETLLSRSSFFCETLILNLISLYLFSTNFLIRSSPVKNWSSCQIFDLGNNICRTHKPETKLDHTTSPFAKWEISNFISHNHHQNLSDTIIYTPMTINWMEDLTQILQQKIHYILWNSKKSTAKTVAITAPIKKAQPPKLKITTFSHNINDVANNSCHHKATKLTYSWVLDQFKFLCQMSPRAHKNTWKHSPHILEQICPILLHLCSMMSNCSHRCQKWHCQLAQQSTISEALGRIIYQN